MTQTGEDEGASVTDVNQSETKTADQSANNGTVDDSKQENLANGDGTGDLATVIAERDDYLDRLQRSMAEFANYRRRVEQDRNRARELATSNILVQLLPIMDDLERAIANVPADQAETSFVQGVQFIQKKLAGLFERESVTPIAAVGQPFDPAVHEAVATEDGSTQNVVVEVYQTGYRHGEQVLRPAMVKVGDKREFQA
jgi:molecular chaperone GrpE